MTLTILSKITVHYDKHTLENIEAINQKLIPNGLELIFHEKGPRGTLVYNLYQFPIQKDDHDVLSTLR